MSEIKKPRLFYWDDAVDSWLPVPDRVENIIEANNFLADGDVEEIQFKRVDMSDSEFDNLPNS